MNRVGRQMNSVCIEHFDIYATDRRIVAVDIPAAGGVPFRRQRSRDLEAGGALVRGKKRQVARHKTYDQADCGYEDKAYLFSHLSFPSFHVLG